jgi:hypothetical protein
MSLYHRTDRRPSLHLLRTLLPAHSECDEELDQSERRQACQGELTARLLECLPQDTARTKIGACLAEQSQQHPLGTGGTRECRQFGYSEKCRTANTRPARTRTPNAHRVTTSRATPLSAPGKMRSPAALRSTRCSVCLERVPRFPLGSPMSKGCAPGRVSGLCRFMRSPRGSEPARLL